MGPGVAVGDGVAVAVGLGVGVGESVAVAVAVGVTVGGAVVSVGVTVSVNVAVGEAVRLGDSASLGAGAGAAGATHPLNIAISVMAPTASHSRSVISLPTFAYPPSRAPAYSRAGVLSKPRASARAGTAARNQHIFLTLVRVDLTISIWLVYHVFSVKII